MAASSTLKWILVGEDKASPAFKSAASGLDVLAKKSTDTGKTMSMAITAPLVGIAAVGIKTASDFGVTMASMQVNSNATGAEMESLRALALKMGADTVYSANEAGQAMLELSKAGVSTADITGGALAAAMNLAATEGIDLAESATIVSNAMNTFGLSGEDATKVADLLAAGAVASSASVQDLAAGMKYVGSTAASLDVPMGDAVTALAALNSAGLDSSTAGTSLNRFLLGLIPKSQKAAETMKELGIQFQNADGSMKTMPEILQILQSELGNMAAPDRVKALKDMFGVEGMRAANILMAEGVDGWQELSAEVGKGGVAADLANARMSGMAGAIETMKGSLETAALTIGETLAPKVEALAGKITALVNWFTNLDSGTKGWITNIGIAAAAMGPLLWGFGKAIELGQSFVHGLSMLHKAWQIGHAIARVYTLSLLDNVKALALTVAQNVKAAATWVAHTAALVAHKAVSVAVSVATKAMAAAQWLLNAAMTANPIGLVIAALAALAVGLKYTWDHSETFRKVVTGAFEAIGRAVLTLAGLWLTYMGKMVDIFLGFVGVVLDGAAKALGWVPGIGPKLKDAADKFDTFRSSVSEKFDAAKGKVNEFKDSLGGLDGKKINIDVVVAWKSTYKGGWAEYAKEHGIPVGSRARGGLISGPGTATSDTAGLFALSDGEYVMSAAAVSRYGTGLFDALNTGTGVVASGSRSGTTGGVTVNIYGGLDSSEAIARRVQTALLDLKRRQGVALGLA